MSLIYDNNHRFVKFGGRLDHCMFCAQELAAEEGIFYGEAEIKSRGLLDGKKVIKFKKSGSDVVICDKHIKEMHEALASVEEGVSEDEEG